MPAEQMLPEIADLWMEQVAGQEMAEMLAFNLLQYVDYAPVIAYQWIASDKPLYEIAGYHILARLFAAKREANERGINEFLDQAAIALQGDNMGVKHAAANCVMRFADMDESYDTIAQKALKGILFWLLYIYIFRSENRGSESEKIIFRSENRGSECGKIIFRSHKHHTYR